MNNMPKFKQHPATLCTEMPDGEMVVLHTENQNIITLNPVGGAVWELCDGQHQTQDIIKMISESMSNMDFAQVEHDVKTFIDEMIRAGLIMEL
jgi:hypothetical protein